MPKHDEIDQLTRIVGQMHDRGEKRAGIWSDPRTYVLLLVAFPGSYKYMTDEEFLALNQVIEIYNNKYRKI